jgi:uncharacterized protein DUF3501
VQTIELSEIRNIAEYELEREQWRAQVLEIKERRRVEVGGHLVFLFENRETVRYQIQEMMRIERIVKPDDIRHEVETYNELIPKRGELSATLLISYPSAAERDIKLRELLGLEDHIWLAVADLPRVKGRFDTRQIATDRISSVQYVKFQLTPEQVRQWNQGAKLVVDHPACKVEQALSKVQLEELSRDLA